MILKTQKITLNSKILLGIIAAALAGAIGFVGLSGSQFINDVSENGFGKISPSPITVLPIQVKLADLSVLSVTDEEATLKIDFEVTNPNYKSVILQLIKYDLYYGDTRIIIGQIGERAEGAVDSSNYFTVLRNSPQIIGDKITIKNSGNAPEFWSALKGGNIKWTVRGEAYFNLSSMTSGQENIIPFEFTT
jgi:LEA14-like dessication related protein